MNLHIFAFIAVAGALALLGAVGLMAAFAERNAGRRRRASRARRIIAEASKSAASPAAVQATSIPGVQQDFTAGVTSGVVAQKLVKISRDLINVESKQPQAAALASTSKFLITIRRDAPALKAHQILERWKAESFERHATNPVRQSLVPRKSEVDRKRIEDVVVKTTN